MGYCSLCIKSTGNLNSFKGKNKELGTKRMSLQAMQTICLRHRLCGQFLDFHGGSLYHVITSPLICSANQFTGFYMLGVSVMKVFNLYKVLTFIFDILRCK